NHWYRTSNVSGSNTRRRNPPTMLPINIGYRIRADEPLGTWPSILFASVAILEVSYGSTLNTFATLMAGLSGRKTFCAKVATHESGTRINLGNQITVRSGLVFRRRSKSSRLVGNSGSNRFSGLGTLSQVSAIHAKNRPANPTSTTPSLSLDDPTATKTFPS